MQVSAILKLLDENKLEELGSLHKIDKANHKITGKFILKSFVNCVVKGHSISLRGLEILTENNKYISSLLNAKEDSNKQIDHSSIGKRLSKIEVGYFRDIYQDLVLKYNNLFSKKRAAIDQFHRFDSTIITLSGKLLKDGLNLGGKADDKHIKLSVGLRNSIPSSLRICKEPAESSEDIALIRAINEAKVEKEAILLFDRGISKTDTFKALTEEKKYFITRVKIGRKYKEIKTNPVEENQEGNIEILSDQVVNLYGSDRKTVDCNLRLVKAKNAQGEELWFLTNVFYLNAQEICASYKKRWEIELFFKFIKQHLQFKRFISHNSNGMSVYLYCILIAAILFTIFKKSNQLSGFKLALLQFTLALEKEIIKDIVLFCGGNPDLVDLKLGGT